MLLEGFDSLDAVTLDCSELQWLGVSDASAPVRVASRCRCPLMGCGDADIVPDGTLHDVPPQGESCGTARLCRFMPVAWYEE